MDQPSTYQRDQNSAPASEPDGSGNANLARSHADASVPQPLPTQTLLIGRPTGPSVVREVSINWDQTDNTITLDELEGLGESTVDKSGITIETIVLKLRHRRRPIFFEETFVVVAASQASSESRIVLGEAGYDRMRQHSYPLNVLLLKKGTKSNNEQEEARSKERHEKEIETERAQAIAVLSKQQGSTPPQQQGGMPRL